MHISLFLIINALTGIGAGAFNLWYAIVHANGKRPLRLLSAAILFYIGIAYVFTIFGYVTEATLGPEFLRPFFPILMLLPVWDAIADGYNLKEKHGAHS